MEYSTNNTAAIFERKSEHLEIVGTGYFVDEGKDKRIIMTKDLMPDGTAVRDIYVKVGRLWDNNSDNPDAPKFTGVFETSSGEKRAATWVRETGKGVVLSIKLREKKDAQPYNSSDDATDFIEPPF